MYAHFKVPKPGWYQIECSGFSQSANDNDAYMFARVIADDDVNKAESEYAVPLTNEEYYSSVTLKKVPANTYNKNNHANYLLVGQELLYNVDLYRDKVAVCVTQEDIDNGMATIRLGIGKNAAVKSNKTGNNGYYDTDFVCADDFRAVYMALRRHSSMRKWRISTICNRIRKPTECRSSLPPFLVADIAEPPI